MNQCMSYCTNCRWTGIADDHCPECGAAELINAEYLHEFQREWKKSVEAAEWIYSLPSGVK